MKNHVVTYVTKTDCGNQAFETKEQAINFTIQLINIENAVSFIYLNLKTKETKKWVSTDYEK